MNVLATLAEPAFAKRAPIRLNSGALGFVIFLWSALVVLAVPGVISSANPRGLALLLAFPAPSLLGALGGFRMWQREVRGKQLVVASLVASFVWSAAAGLVASADARTPSEFILVAALDVLLNLAVTLGAYYLVAASEFRERVRIRDVASVVGVVVGVPALVVFVVVSLLVAWI
jgi:hypothetical protein